MHPCSGAIRLERPRPVHWERTLDDVDVEAPGAVELGELRYLLELPAQGRLEALPEARAESGRSVGELLRRSVDRLPVGEVGRVRHVVEHDLGRPADCEGLLDAHEVRIPGYLRPVKCAGRDTESGAAFARRSGVATRRLLKRNG